MLRKTGREAFAQQGQRVLLVDFDPQGHATLGLGYDPNGFDRSVYHVMADNFLPIPALDGGHMLFLAAEWIRGKPLNERLQVTLTLIGVGCLLSLMVLVFTLDIQRFF